MPTSLPKDDDKKLLALATAAAMIGADVEIDSAEKSHWSGPQFTRTITISWLTHTTDGRHLS